MNQLLLRGKYSMIVEDDGEEVGTSEQPKEGWKQCDYVSNRTRLRCQNVRRHEKLRDYGFCEEHRGFIDRVRQEGLQAKQCFDAAFNVCQKFHQQINDDDETLLPKHPADFPFVYEPLYCDNRIDNNDNPLSRANVFTKREIIKQYISALRRQDASIQQMRVIYKEKHQRTLHQIMELREKSRLAKLHPIKDSRKIERVLAMRHYLLRHCGSKTIEKEDASQTCARINQPWDGTRHAGTKSMGGERDQMANNVNCNRNSSNAGETVRIHLPQPETTYKPRRENDNNFNASYGSYRQYLSMQRLMPGAPRFPVAKTIARI